MTESDFTEIVENRLDRIKELLLVKGREYRRNGKIFHNFEQGALLNNTTREAALWGYLSKQIVSFMDFVNDTKEGKYPSVPLLEEKVGDIMTYMILAEALFKDSIAKEPLFNEDKVFFNVKEAHDKIYPQEDKSSDNMKGD